jgi:hypothetical protein
MDTIIIQFSAVSLSEICSFLISFHWIMVTPEEV